MSMRTPSYRLHKGSGQAVVTLNGKDVYLGKFGSTVSKDEYDRIIGEWMANGRQVAQGTDLTVVELVVAYLRYAEGYYKKNGEPTSELRNIGDALRPSGNSTAIRSPGSLGRWPCKPFVRRSSTAVSAGPRSTSGCIESCARSSGRPGTR